MTQSIGAGQLGPTFRGANLAALTFDPNALVEKQWFIDPVHGSDTNVGNLITAPLQTHAELVRRLGRGVTVPVQGEDQPLAGSTFNVNVITILGDLPSTDPLDLTIIANDLWAYQGTRTTLRSGTLTAATPQNRATNTPWSITDGALDWTPFLGKRIRITAGPNINQTAWIAKNLGGGSARISSPSNPGYPPPESNLAIGMGAPGVFSAGDPYVIEDLSKIFIRSMYADSDYSHGFFGVVAFVDFDFQGDVVPGNPPPNVLAPQGTAITNFVACKSSVRMMTNIAVATVTAINCEFDQGFFVQGSFQVDGGLSRGRVRLFGASTLDGDFMVQGVGIEIRGSSVLVGSACVFDAPADAVVIGEGAFSTLFSSLLLHDTLHGVHALWGKDNAGVGVSVGVGARMGYAASIPSIVGAGGNFRLGGAATARAWDEAGGAYTAALPCTWANLALAIGAGGFGGSCHNVQSDAHMLGGVV